MTKNTQQDAATGIVIQVDGLTKRFGSFTAVDQLSFDVGRGEIFGFLGPNGAGKSTTIRMLCGLLTPSAGDAIVGGYSVGRAPERVRENIGYMSQKFSLYRDLTVRENIAFFGGVYGLEGDHLRAREQAVLAMAGLSGLEDRMTGVLSGAHQQRLALGCAILHEPPILFLDEPTSGVDPISRRMFWDLIQDLAARGVTILVTTHFMDEAEFCGRLGFISGGRLVALDRPSALKRDAVLDDLFEVELPLSRNAKEQVDAQPGVVMSSYFGTRLHVFCERGAYTPETFAQALSGAGLAVRSARKVPVSLEDVFLRLVSGDRAAAATP